MTSWCPPVPNFAVQVVDYVLVPKVRFIYFDAPDELAAKMGAMKMCPNADPVRALSIVGDVVPLGDDCRADQIDACVDRNGDDLVLEVI